MTLYGVDLWAAVLVFTRVGALVMLLPGFGEPAVTPRARLTLALALTVLITPVVGAGFPPAPEALAPAAGMLVGEALIGLATGLVARIIVSALGVAGQIAGIETGLSFSTTLDPTASGGGQIFGVFFSLLGTLLIFTTDLHHVFLQGLVGGYRVFAPGAPFAVADWSEMAVSATSQSFLIATQISAPLIVAGLVFRVGLGVLSRVAPQIQVFFVAMPLNLLGGFMVIALALSAGLYVWLEQLAGFAESVG